MNWYYVNAGQQAGPVDEAALNALEASGKITPETLVWREGMANWQPYRDAKSSGTASGDPAAGATAAAQSGVVEAVCAECGGIFPASETIRVGDVRVCAKCKPVFVQKIREGVNPGGAFQYAGFWIRFAAVFLDGLMLSAVKVVLNIAVLGFGGAMTGFMATPNTSVALLPILGLVAIQLLIAVSYETIMIGKYGATLGKMACGVRVITADGGQVSYARSLGRYFSKMVSSIICLIGYIMAGFDEEKRALHDRMCNTRVVFK